MLDFDDGAAEKLIAACEAAARMLESQRGPRQSVIGTAVAEFRGVFADQFHANTDAERGARSALIEALEDAARQVREAKHAAEVERDRLRALVEWQSRAHSAHGGLASVGIVAVDLGPRPTTTETPRPVITMIAARQRFRSWPTGTSSTGTSSADPDALESASAVFRRQDDATEGSCDSVIAALGTFEDACSWVLTDDGALRSGLRRFVNDNREDAIRLAAIASAFRAAGGNADVGMVTLTDTTLVLASAPAEFTGEALLAFLSTATAGDLKALSGIRGWTAALRGLPPERIASWWAAMNPDRLWAEDGRMLFAQQQELLLASAPAVFGALDGLPATARVQANRINATVLLKASEKELDVQLGSWSIGQPRGDANRVALLKQEIAYLTKVQRGDIQLYPLQQRPIADRGDDRNPLPGHRTCSHLCPRNLHRPERFLWWWRPADSHIRGEQRARNDCVRV